MPTMDLLALFTPEQVLAWITAGGYLVLFGLLFACGLGLPLPEDIPLIIAGALVSNGKMELAVAGICCWCGIIGGDCVLYYMSRKYGMEVTRFRLIGRHVTRERILWVETLFDKYGILVVAVCRLFAGVRGAMVIAAGVTRYNFIKFVIADGLAALVSGGLFIALGHWLGNIDKINHIRAEIKHWESLIVGVILGIALATTIWYIFWRKKKHTTLGEVALKKAVTRIGHTRQEQSDRQAEETEIDNNY